MMTKALFTLLLCLVLGAPPASAEPGAPVAPSNADQDPANAEHLLARGWTAFEEGDHGRAIELATQLIREQPESADGYYLRGMVLAEGLKYYERAIADLVKVNRLDTDFADALGARGWLLILLGRWDEAQEVTRKARALAPENYHWSVNLGHTYLLRGDQETAHRWYQYTVPLVTDETNLVAGPVADFELFVELGWEVRSARAERDWFLKAWGEWQAFKALYRQVTEHYRNAQYRQAIRLTQDGIRRTEILLGAMHPEVASSLNNLAVLLETTGRYGEAEPLHRRALGIRQKVFGSQHPHVAISLVNLAKLLQTTGRYGEAERLSLQALAIFEAAHDSEHPDVATGLNNLAGLLLTTGRYGEAEPLTRRALAIREKVLGPEHPDVAESSNNLAELLRTTGRYGEAEPLQRRALAIFEMAHGLEHPHVAQSLNNLAALLLTTGRYGEAESLYRRALAIREKALGSQHSGVAMSLNNLAVLLRTTGRHGEAEPLYRRALTIQETALGPEHPDVARSINNLASLLQATGRSGEAAPLLRRALSIAGAAGEPELLGNLQGNLGAFYDLQSRPGTAIFFGKQAVNTLQSVRGGMKSLDRSAQQAFVKSKEGVYKRLSDLLIAAGRLAEAQQVLEMLKEAEYFQFVRRDASEDVRQSRIAYNAFEQQQLEYLERAMAPLRRIGAELADLERIDAQLRRPEETERLAALREDHKAASEGLFRVVDGIELAFGELGAERQEALNALLALPSDQRALVRRLGQGTVLVQYLVLEDQLRILLTSPGGITAYRVAAEAKAINQAVFALYEALRSPGLDPRPASRGLYDILIRPIAEDLAAHQARQLMVYLDGTLRYLPLAALHDGERYLIERYAIAVYTSVGRERIAQRPAADWSVSALGTSRAVEGFAPLPAVRQELEGIVRRDAQDPDGVLAGTIRLDQAFTRAGLAASLGDRSPVLHLATHFVFKPGTESDSYLLLGDGSRLDLRALRTGEYDLGAIDLLTLSACETAIGGANAEGKEIEGMGALAQRKGAKGVLATLWPVADASTGLFMQRLYRLRTEQGLTKAEALRRTQLAFLSGQIEGAAGKARGVLIPLTPDSDESAVQAARGYRHPYYWAPFILMGNWL